MRMPYDGTFIDQMIDRQARLYPSRMAVCWGGKDLYIRRIKERSDELAAFLISRDIRPKDRVAFLCGGMGICRQLCWGS